MTNEEIIAVNQDALASPIMPVVPSPAGTPPPLHAPPKGLQVWKKPLASGAIAVVFFNRGSNDSWRRPRPGVDGDSADAGKFSRSREPGSIMVRAAPPLPPPPPPPPASKMSVTWAELGLPEGAAMEVRDLWARKVLGTFTEGQFSAMVEFHGAEIYTFTKRN